MSRPRTVGICMARDEADIIGTTVGHMLAECDAVIVADNLSTDETRPILEQLAAEHAHLLIVDDLEPAYRQSAKMTALARRARLELAAEWVVPFDADEWWYSPFGHIADVLADVAEQWLVVPAPLFDHVATAEDPADVVDPVARLGFRRRDRLPLPKVACRWRDDLVIEQGNHAATYRGRATSFDELLVVRHFPYRSAEQVTRKVRNGAAALAAATELPASSGQHWREWGAILEQRGEPAIAELFHTWYYRARPREPLELYGQTERPLMFDPAPGQ